MGKAMCKVSEHTGLLGQGRPRAFPFVYIAVAAMVLYCLVPVTAAAQPTGYQDYYVLGYEEHVWRAFLAVYDGPDSDIPIHICSTVSVVATANYQIIYYDHWEDGYEADLLHPVQATTEVYGDGEPGNGGTGSDILLAGDDISLTSDQDNDTMNGYVPVAPRNADQIRYDGGDRVVSSGGPVGLTHAMWPLGRAWVGGAWEIYSRQVYADAYSYHLLIGEDLYTFGGGNYGTYGDFRNVYLELGTFEDDTTVSIDNGTHVVNLTLDRGQTYSSIGYINSTPFTSIAINAGTTVRSNKPIQAGLITGAESPDGSFQGRFLIALPDKLWGADYVVPVPRGDDTPVGRDAPAEIYLSNPNDFPITIHASDAEMDVDFVISPGSTISATVPYSEKRKGWGYVPQDSAARFTSSDGIFGVVVCADTSRFTYDWGFSGIPTSYLTRDYYVPWAPGTTDLSDNASPVWVTPTADRTTFYVDFSPLDGVVDSTFTLDVLEQRRIFDRDNDNTGMHIWATGDFAAAWGEDPRTASTRNRYLDLGFAVLPLQQSWLDPVLTLDKTAEPTILPPTGGEVTFTLLAQAHSAPLVDVNITDTLPVHWSYVPGSTRVTYPGGSTVSLEPTVDDRTLYWNTSASLGLNQSLMLTFKAQITDTAGVTASTNRGEAIGRLQHMDVLFNPSDEATVYISPLDLIKSVNSAQARVGDTLVYTLSYANLSDSTLTKVVLRDVLPVQHVTFQSASHGGIYDPANGTVAWTLGALAPGASDSVSVAVEVNDFVKDGTVIKNVGYIDSAQTSEAGSNTVHTTVLAPKIEFTKTGPTAATRGQVITFTLSYENVGGAPATGVTIQDRIPNSTTYMAGSLGIKVGSRWISLTDDDDGDQGAYIPPTLVITPGAIPGTIAAGEAGQIRFSVRLDDDLSPGATIQNWATLDRDLDIPRESNLVVVRVSDLLIHKAADRPTVAPGGTIWYTLDYENASEMTTHTEVYVREPIPNYTSLIPGTPYGGDRIEYSSDNGATWSTTPPSVPITHIRWYDADLLAGAQARVGFAVQADATLPPDTTIRNTAHITSTETAAYFRQWIPSNQVEVATSTYNYATIYGTVFQDTDGDGMRDTGETGIPNVLITLDGVITTTTDLNGVYTFSTTVAGTHTVVETDPTFLHTRATPEAGSTAGGPTDMPGYFSTTPNEVQVDVILGGSYRVDFGDMLTTGGFASIYGTVFEDVDGDGVRDVGELGIPNVLITLDGTTATTTDLNGNYTLSTTEPGTHTVVETDPTGYLSTTPNERYLRVNLGNGYQVDFGDMPVSAGFATIYGTVFQDTDADGGRDVDESGIPNVLITLDGAIATSTGVNGDYAFSTPVAGTHIVVETDPADYISTTPNEVPVSVTLGSSYRVDFGDAQQECGPDIYEDDDTYLQARSFIVGTNQAHQFCWDLTDWVKFPARASTFYTITTSAWGQRADTVLELYDTDGRTLLASNDDWPGTTDGSSRIIWETPANGVYYVFITNRIGIGPYTDYDLMIAGDGPFRIYLPRVMRNRSESQHRHR